MSEFPTNCKKNTSWMITLQTLLSLLDKEKISKTNTYLQGNFDSLQISDVNIIPC